MLQEFNISRDESEAQKSIFEYSCDKLDLLTSLGGRMQENHVFKKLQKADYSNGTCAGKSFDRADLRYTLFCYADICNCKFDETNLESSDLSYIEAVSASFYKANLKKTDFCYSNLSGLSKETLSSIGDTGLKGTRFIASDLRQASFYNADMRWCDFTACDMRQSILEYTLLNETDFHGCDLRNASFSHSKIKRYYDKWRDIYHLRSNFYECNLSFCDFSHADINGAVFEDCILENVDFSNSNMLEVIFRKCKVNECIFTQAAMSRIEIDSCTLSLPNEIVIDEFGRIYLNSERQ